MVAPALNTKQVREVERILISWSTKLTWQLLVERIEIELEIAVTRQTLSKYRAIQSAYKLKKQALRGQPNHDFIEFTQKNVDTYQSLRAAEAKVAVLQRQIDAQLVFIQKIFEEADSYPQLRALLIKLAD
ncbi:hypothetical protein [Ferrimonas futtsuensis]|uniref:hypothetical protein n=1 Tax=Ferrimonas futtsuensis TaxID=364764 RepID=UPI00054E7584|nr:hypothetical protein [Ferrimonas futtsuensis]